MKLLLRRISRYLVVHTFDLSCSSISLIALADERSMPPVGPRAFSQLDISQNDGQEGRRFWCVVDGFVCDVSEFVDSHPGGLRKLLSANTPAAGATGQMFGFSFSRGPNAHFPRTAQRFADGVERFLQGVPTRNASEHHLPSTEVAFPPYGSIEILGRIRPAHHSGCT